MNTDNSEAMRLIEPPNIENLKKIAASDSTTAIRNGLLAAIKWIQNLDQSLKFEQAASFRNQVAELEAERDLLRAEVIANRERDALKLAALHIHSEMRSIVQAGGSNEAIGREFRERVILDVEDEVVKLRAEVERLRAEAVPLGAIRGIAVEAIRYVIGCPDLSNDGKHLSDVMDETARHATYAAIAARTHKETK